MEDEAMYIALEGVKGTGCCLGVLDEGDSVLLLGVDGLIEPLCSDTALFWTSDATPTRGGGNGEIESAVVDAV